MKTFFNDFCGEREVVYSKFENGVITFVDSSGIPLLVVDMNDSDNLLSALNKLAKAHLNPDVAVEGVDPINIVDEEIMLQFKDFIW